MIRFCHHLLQYRRSSANFELGYRNDDDEDKVTGGGKHQRRWDVHVEMDTTKPSKDYLPRTTRPPVTLPTVTTTTRMIMRRI